MTQLQRISESKSFYSKSLVFPIELGFRPGHHLGIAPVRPVDRRVAATPSN